MFVTLVIKGNHQQAANALKQHQIMPEDHIECGHEHCVYTARVYDVTKLNDWFIADKGDATYHAGSLLWWGYRERYCPDAE